MTFKIPINLQQSTILLLLYFYLHTYTYTIYKHFCTSFLVRTQRDYKMRWISNLDSSLFATFVVFHYLEKKSKIMFWIINSNNATNTNQHHTTGNDSIKRKLTYHFLTVVANAVKLLTEGHFRLQMKAIMFNVWNEGN